MAFSDFHLVYGDPRRDSVRLRTLILLRWMAIVGQVGAITVAELYFGLQLPLGACLSLVFASIVVNLIAVFAFPQSKRLTQNGAMFALLFDVTQLCFLIYLTGGLNNPFALLVIAPVTISAGVLELRSTVFLALTSILLISLVAVFNIPLLFLDGSTMALPSIFSFGFWLAIVIGVIFIALYSRRVAIEVRAMSDALLATQIALSREQTLTDLGGVVAATAHELGTPLATIKLASTELIDELADRPELREDAQLIRAQADRCRDILQSMGRAGKDDLHFRTAPFESIVREAAEPHLNRGKIVHFSFESDLVKLVRQPMIRRRSETIHGLRNLIQNAVDFAEGNVWVQGSWNEEAVFLKISDDGTGFPSGVLGRIGDPFVKERRGVAADSRRPGYEGMGLGLFIAKTLLERTGAAIRFANAADPPLGNVRPTRGKGAIVHVKWPRTSIEKIEDAALGDNRPVEI
jgi:two-component system sensor histidine kinase RegB